MEPNREATGDGMARRNGGASTLAQRQLGKRLKYHRERARKTQDDAAEALITSKYTVWRIESGQIAAKPGDVRELAAVYQISDGETSDLLDLARGASQQGWTDRYRDAVPDTLGLYAGMEGTASAIRAYSPEALHGLLQTPEYAQAMFDTAPESEEIRRRRLAFRLERQAKVLARPSPPRMQFVIAEAALRYVVGSAEIMREQTEHLVHLADAMDIRAWPFSAGGHLWMAGGAFGILTFPKPDPEVIYLETHIGAEYMETSEQLTEYSEIFAQLYERSVPIKEFAA